MKGKGGKLRFMSLLMLIGIIPLVVALAVVSVVNISTLKNELKSGMFEKLEIASTDLCSYYSKILAETGDIPYETAYVDSLKSQGVELTLFREDTRQMTSILNDKGERNEGTKADAAIYAEVKSGNKVEKADVVIAGSKYYVDYLPIYDANGDFWGMSFSGASQEKMDKLISTMVIKNIVISVAIAAVFIIIVVIIALDLQRKMTRISVFLGEMAEGYISISEDINVSVKEMSDINNSAHKLQENLESVIRGVKESAGSLTDSIVSVDSLCDDNANGADQISQAVSELANTAQSLAESVQDTSNQTIVMGENIDEISTNVSELLRSSEAIKAANDEAMEHMHTVMTSSGESVQAVQAISKQIEDTNAAVDKINDCVSMIMTITSQTKLLALNASIEAARAGDAGKGFAVVATEIGNLASQSSESAERITSLVKDVLEASAESVEGSEQIKAAINKEQGYVKDTQSKFEVLSREVEASIEEIKAINEKTEALTAIKNQITSNISDLSAISEENGASAEEVSASTITISQGILETKEKSSTMNTLSEALKDLVKFFR